MEYNSFYGGRQGAPFILTGRFERINSPEEEDDKIRAYYDLSPQETITNAQRIGWADHVIRISVYGEDSGQDVSSIRDSWIEEKCMIPAFRKGNNYKVVNYDEYAIIDTVVKNDSDNGKIYRRGRNFVDNGNAIYIGQIVGPTGDVPILNLKQMSEIDQVWPSIDSDFKSSIELTKANMGLVPGKTNSSILCKMYTIENENGDRDSAYLGFQIPYLEIEYTATALGAYNTPTATRLDNKANPFYEKWRLGIPAGKVGDSVSNVRVITANNNDGVEYYATQNDDRLHSRQIMVYDLTSHATSTAVTKTYYLGPYNMISSMTNDDGGLEIQFTYADTITIEDVFKYIEDTELDPTTGDLNIYYNTGEISSAGTIRFIKNITGDSGYIKIEYSDDPQGEHTTFIWQGTTNSTGAVITQETGSAATDPKPEFTEGSPWFIVETITD